MDELEHLAELRDKGLITEKEFEVERVKIVPSAETIKPEPDIWKGYPGSSNRDQENDSTARKRPPAPTPAPSGKQSRLAKVRQKVEEAGLVESSDLDMIDDDLTSQVTNAVEKAKNSPLPNVEELTTNVYEKGSY